MQILVKKEFPLALYAIMGGIRTSMVINVGIATLAALIAAGGLGTLIVRGIQTINTDLILAGAIPAAILAISIDIILERVENALIPPGDQQGRSIDIILFSNQCNPKHLYMILCLT